MSRTKILLWCIVLSMAITGNLVAQSSAITDGKHSGEKAPPIWNFHKLQKWYDDHGLILRHDDALVPPRTVPLTPLPPDEADVQIFPSANHETENSIAVSQANPQNLMVSVNELSAQPAWFSTNGGANWFGNESNPGGTANFGDPVALFDLSGAAYWVTLASPGGIKVGRTTNFGTTWTVTSADPLNSTNNDKEHAMTDLSGVYPNNVYVAWTDFGVSGTPVVLTRSTDHGATWSARTSFPVSGGGQGTNIATGPNGEVYLTFCTFTGGSLPEGGIAQAKSTDGGTTWSAATVLFPINGIRVVNTGQTRFNNTRAPSFPSTGVDRSTGPRRGWVYITYAGDVTSSHLDADIFLRRSSDGGTTWSSAIRVNNEAPGSQQWMPGLAVDPTSGRLSVGYYSMDTTVAFLTARYIASSDDGGDTWQYTRVSDVRFTPSPLPPPYAGGYCGDYYETASYNGKAWTCWSDNRVNNTFNAYVSRLLYTDNFGFVQGTVTALGGSTPVSGASIDFVEPVLQQGATTNSAGIYFAGAKVDTPGTTANLTLRGRKFGYIDTTIAVTLTRGDTLTRNFQMRTAPGGTLSVQSHTATTNLRSYVEVKFGSLVVISDSTNGTTGLLTAPLPVGTYSVRVDAPAPYRTLNYPAVVINNGATTNVDALTTAVLTFNPTSARDTLPVGGSHSKTVVMTNTTPDTVQFRITDDNALARVHRIIDPNLPSVKRSMEQQRNITLGKGEPDPQQGGQPASPNGHGGPDAFGYSWIDSDDPGGPIYNWTDIKGVGTQITTWTGSPDDGYAAVALPFSFPFYGTSFTSMNVVTNGFIQFGGGTSTAFTNAAIPATAVPNNAIYPFWDDFNFNEAGGTAWYYFDTANQRFILQYDSVSHYLPATTPGRYTFQMILKPNGEVICQYKTMAGTTNSATLGIENAGGTVALQVVFNAAYMHDNLALRFFLPDAPWLAENPILGAIPPNASQNLLVTFDASGLTAGTTYNANIAVDATHPDVVSPFQIPASLRVQSASGQVLLLNKTSLTIPQTAIGSSRTDSSIVARNIGTTTLNISSITRVNNDFSVTPGSAVLNSGDSTRIRVTYTPTVPAGADTGKVILLSNSGPPSSGRDSVFLYATSIGVPVFQARVDSLTKVLQARNVDSTKFYVRNTGTMSGDIAARAVLYPHTAAGVSSDPIVIPVTLKKNQPVRVEGAASSVQADRSPFSGRSGTPNPLAPQAQFDLQFDYDASVVTGAAGNAAAVFINGEFWTSRWASTLLHRWTPNGTLIQEFSISGVTGVRGLATDGQFLYASSNTATIYKIDPVTKTLVGTITCPSPVTTRTIAYDPVRDGFWVSNFADALTCVNRSGAAIASIPNTLAAKYGSAYDNYTPGGPYLWVFDQTNTAGGTPQNVWQFNLTTLTQTGVAFDVTTRITTGGATPIAGGLFITTGLVPGKATIGGLLQGAPDRLFGLELADAGGGGTGGPWLAVKPTAGTIATNDSVQFTATFDARDESIVNNPGTYLGRIEVNATNSALADTLKIPVRFTVTPIVGAALVATPDSIGFGNVAIGVTDSSKTFLVKNIGNATLNVTNITSSNAAFSVNRTSFSLNSSDTTRIRVRFAAPTPAGLRQGTLAFVSNDPGAVPVKVTGTSIGQANIVVVPDTFFFSRTAGTDTTRATFKVRNTGSDTLRYTITEATSSLTNSAVARSTTQQVVPNIGKGEHDPTPGQSASPDGHGGPDAFGYSWIDSDEPGGPVFNWVDIASVGTPVTTWTGSADDGSFTATLPWAFPFYGTNQTSINIVTNGFANFGTTATTFSNTAIPTTAVPNNALYPNWDDLDLRTSGTVYYYNDAANQRYIVQWNNVPHYALGSPVELDTLTFQIILRPAGDILYQYLRKATAESTATVGVENSDGTIALQTSFNRRYVKPNLAVLITKDLLPWTSTDRTSGTIAPADSQSVELRIHPAGLASGTYFGRQVITGNTPDIGRVRIRLDITGGGAPITVSAPNGGENWTVGSSQQIAWSRDPALVDTVKIELSRAGSSGPWEVLTAGVPARPTAWQHPKGLVRPIEGSYVVMSAGAFNWTVTGPVSTNCYVRVSKKSNPTLFDISDAPFSITPVPLDTSWVTQTSGVTTDLYCVKAVDANVAWAGGGTGTGTSGTVLRTTNGGTNWTTVGTFPGDVYTITAVDANTAIAANYTAAYTKLVRTTNGGSSWQTVDSVAGGFYDYVHLFNATTGYAMGDPVGGNWTLKKSTNGGATWSNASTLAGTDAGWNNSMMWLDANNGWFGSNSSKVYHTTNGGTTWTSVATTFANSYSVGFAAMNTGLTGSDLGTFNKSTDSGSTWTTGPGALSAANLGLWANPGTQEFWATNGNNVNYSSNFGTTWSTAGNNGYTGTQQQNHVNMVKVGGNLHGWAVGNAGAIERFRRIVSGVQAGSSTIPDVYALEQNFPNPFNPTTTIRFSLPEQSTVSLRIYNLLGQEIATLADGEMPAAFHNVVWSGKNEAGSQVASGIYFYRLEATGVSGGKFNSLKKLILLK